MTYIPDPLELLEARQERWMDEFIDEFTCMECGNRYDYEMICVDPLGCGPCICDECLQKHYPGFWEEIDDYNKR